MWLKAFYRGCVGLYECPQSGPYRPFGRSGVGAQSDQRRRTDCNRWELFAWYLKNIIQHPSSILYVVYFFLSIYGIQYIQYSSGRPLSDRIDTFLGSLWMSKLSHLQNNVFQASPDPTTVFACANSLKQCPRGAMLWM